MMKTLLAGMRFGLLVSVLAFGGAAILGVAAGVFLRVMAVVIR